MKSQTLRTYEYNGKTYQFNRIGFIDAIQIAQKNGNTDTRITQSTLFEKIADRIERTPDAVKNWKSGNNSPLSLEFIEVCADVLGVDINLMLTPVEETKGVAKLNDKEIALIEMVFEECINSVYLLQDSLAKMLADKTERDVRSVAKTQYEEKLSEGHRIVDAKSLFISSSVKYRLHRILNDMAGCEWTMPGRWGRIDFEDSEKCGGSCAVDEDMVDDLTWMSTREDALNAYGLYFIEEEKALAEKLDYKYPDIPDEYYEKCDYINGGVPYDKDGNEIPLDKLRVYDSDFEVTASIFVKDAVTRLVKKVFANDFPELTFPE